MEYNYIHFNFQVLIDSLLDSNRRHSHFENSSESVARSSVAKPLHFNHFNPHTSFEKMASQITRRLVNASTGKGRVALM